MSTDTDTQIPVDPGQSASTPADDIGTEQAAITQPFGPYLRASSFLAPRHVDLSTVPPWMEHGPFAFWLMESLQPSTFVELGTHTGFSYFSFCQAVETFQLHTRCYAVDTWKGDEQAGFYDEGVFERVRAVNDERYSSFSELIRCRFEDALPYFADGEVDLLHIDGRHAYEDVKADFESWLPKLSSRAVVLLHDTNVERADFGVRRFWQERSRNYPSFTFIHGHGLGVLAVGPDVPSAIRSLSDAPPGVAAAVRLAYSKLGKTIVQQRNLLVLQSELSSRNQALERARAEAEQHIEALRTESADLRLRLVRMEQDAAAAGQDALAALEAERADSLREMAELKSKLARAEARIADAAYKRAEAQQRFEHHKRFIAATERRLADAGHALREARQRTSDIEAELVAARRDLDAIRYSTLWRATQPLRTVLGSEALRPMRKILRRGARAAYWTVTLQFPKRYTEWRKTQRTLSTSSALRLGVPAAQLSVQDSSPTGWFRQYRSNADCHAVKWQGSVMFTVIIPVYKVRPQWLEETIASVIKQTNHNWELICVDDHSDDASLSAVLNRAAESDSRVQIVTLDRNHGVSYATNIGIEQAAGKYILLLDHDDLLEPHAIARLGDAAFLEDADLIYGDEVVTAEDPDQILGVQARPAFSYTYYLSHPYFVHPVAVRTSLAREIGGLDTSLSISQDIDFVLRVIEKAATVTHVPDILYRWRTVASSAGHRRMADVTTATCSIKAAHLRRLGFADAEVRGGASFNTYNVRYFGPQSSRVLCIIPTRNRVQLLSRCVETVRDTTSGIDLDLVIVDHQSDDPETREYLRELEKSGNARVLPYEGEFNYGSINNHAVTVAGARYDYYLFLNNDIEATNSVWLGAMMDVAARADVGVVGATLLYPDGLVQHAGVIVGMHGVADHAFRTVPLPIDTPGYGGSLHSTREYSAVTAACMLVPASVFHAVGGFDEKIAVGFGDTDLCLRIGKSGLRVVNCAEAILLHHESASRGKSLDGRDPHPRDTAIFCHRYRHLIHDGDPCFSPLLAVDNPTFVLNFSARLLPSIDYRTTRTIRPIGRRQQHAVGGN